jgi:hypothetical protein
MLKYPSDGDIYLFCGQYICTLDISMYDTLLMQVNKAFQHLIIYVQVKSRHSQKKCKVTVITIYAPEQCKQQPMIQEMAQICLAL